MRNGSKMVVLAIAMMTAAAGCVGGTHLDGWEDGDEKVTVGPSGTQGKTIDARFQLMPRDSSISVNARRMAVTGGDAHVIARADGTLVLDELTLALADQTISDTALPPDGLELRTIRAHLIAPVSARADVTGDVRFARVTAAMELEWSFVTHAGELAALTPQTFEELTIDVSLVDGGTRAVVTAKKDGELWRWNGNEQARMRDLVLDLTLARK